MNNNIRIARELVRLAAKLIMAPNNDNGKKFTVENAVNTVMDWLMKNKNDSYQYIHWIIKDNNKHSETKDKNGITYKTNKGDVLLHVYEPKVNENNILITFKFFDARSDNMTSTSTISMDNSQKWY